MTKNYQKERSFPLVGMLPPSNPECERSVMATLVMYPRLLPVVRQYVKKGMFYLNEYNTIFDHMCRLSEKMGEYSYASLLQDVDDDLALSELRRLPAFTGSTVSIDRDSMIIMELHIKRQFIFILNKHLKSLLTEKIDIADIYDAIRDDLDKLFNIDERDINAIHQHEMVLLSACMNNELAAQKIISTIDIKMFSKVIHKDIYARIQMLSKEGLDISHQSIFDAMAKHGLLSIEPELKRINEWPNKNWKHSLTFITGQIEARRLNILAMKIITHDYKNISEIIDEMSSIIDDNKSKESQSTNTKSAIKKAIGIIKSTATGKEKSYLLTNDRVLNNVAFISKNNIVGIAGQQGAGKTRYVIKTIKDILANNEKISVLWFSMEDPDDKIIRCMISNKVNLTEAQMLSKNYTLTAEQVKAIEDEAEQISNYDIEFVNESSSVDTIRARFKGFCKNRPGRWCLLVIDNLMLIKDISSAVTNSTAIEDKAMADIKSLLNETNRDGMCSTIFLLHHLTKDLMSKMNKVEGYRPRISNLKGTTRIPDIANIFLLINNVGQHKDLIREHSSKPDVRCMNSQGTFSLYKRENIMKHLIIVEVAKNRDGEIEDMKGIMRYIVNFGTMSFNELICAK